jgi:hypothetical protein
MYDRESIATRVVEVLPKECWKTLPKIVEDENSEVSTEFEKAWDEVGKSLQEESWFEDKEANPIWEYLLRADILAGIGHYGVMLLGVNDGKELSEPLEPKEGMELLYLRPLDQSLADVTVWETDRNDKRFGRPTVYSLTLNTPSESNIAAVADGGGSTVLSTETQNVHWTRVVHFADNVGTSDVVGRPRMQPVYNRLMDLRKIYGGSAEMFWQGGFFGLSIETHPQLGGDVIIDQAGMRSQMEKYMTGLQRYLSLQGQTANSLAPQVADPASHIDVQLEAISLLTGIPKRILMGSERGELASSQDADTWNTRLSHRQLLYLNPKVIAPFVNRLIWCGVLPTPQQYTAKWPDLEALSETEQADIAVKKTEAVSKYVSGGCDAVIQPVDFLTRFLGMTESEAETVTDAAVEALEEQEMKEADAREEQLKLAEEAGIPQAPSVEGYQNIPQQQNIPIAQVVKNLERSIK